MKPFETDLIKLIENIQFRSGKNHFQKSLANDLKKINSSPNILLFADKTRNIYEASLDTYNKLFNYMTTSQKHINMDPRTCTVDEIDSELKHISNNLGIGDKIDKMKKREAFISLKVHKENFENNPKCRLINPAKSESGNLSKIILYEINSNLRQKLNLNQWRNTKQVIE